MRGKCKASFENSLSKYSIGELIKRTDINV